MNLGNATYRWESQPRCPKGQVKDIFSANGTSSMRTYTWFSFLILVGRFVILYP